MDLLPPVIAGGEEGPHVSRRHEGGYRLYPYISLPLAGSIDGDKGAFFPVPGDGGGVGDGEEAAVVRERNKLHPLGQHRFLAAHPCHGEVGMVEDVPLGVGIEEFWE